MNNVTAIIPCYKNPAYLDLCLKSAVQGRKDKNNKIMVVLDGFVEMFKDVMEKYKDEVDFYGYEQNRGMQSALNYGVFLTETNYIFILNDDNVFGDEWDIKLVQHCEPNTVVTVDQVEPIESMFRFVIKDFGRDLASFQYDAWWEFEKTIAEDKKTPTGCIFPFMISKKLYLASGGFDTLYNSPNVCDWDFFLKLQLLKVRATRVHNLHLYHFGSVVTKKGEEAERFKQRETLAGDVFEQKWGWRPMNVPGSNIKFPMGQAQFNGISLPSIQDNPEYLEWK